MNNNSVLNSFRSGYRALHSTETALGKIAIDLLLTADRDECSVFVLLDLGAAFDSWSQPPLTSFEDLGRH